MKVCHLTSVHHHTDTRIFLKECRSLAAHSYEVTLIAPNATEGMFEGVQVLTVQKDGKGRLSRMLRTTKLVLERAKEMNADVYHFHDPELIPVGLKLKKLGKRVIYDAHEDVPRQILAKSWIKSSIRRFVSQSFEYYENKAAKKLDAVITATPFINERFLALGCQAVNVNNYPILKELHIPNVDWSQKERTVCYVGGLGKIRGLFEMVEAMNHVDDLQLSLAGRFSVPSEREAAVNKGGWNKVSELGFIDRQQVSALFSRSIAGLVILHPTRNYLDSLPIKMFEYMSAGLPVIASNFPLWKTIIEQNKCGICVDPYNPKEIADAIQWLADHPQEAKVMGENGRKAVEKLYNWENESKKLLELYEAISVKQRLDGS